MVNKLMIISRTALIFALAVSVTGCGGGDSASDATGFATPEAVVDAYIKTSKAGDIEGFKKLVARSEKFKADFDNILGVWKGLDVVKTDEEGWKKLVTEMVAAGQSWADGPHKKFPAEVTGNTARLIGAHGGTPDSPPSYVEYQLQKEGDKWYYTGFSGIGAEKLDMEKYKWEAPAEQAN